MEDDTEGKGEHATGAEAAASQPGGHGTEASQRRGAKHILGARKVAFS